MAQCLNRNTKEFKDLVIELNSTDPIGLAADIEIWQDANGLDKFPTKLELVPNKGTYKEISSNTNIKAIPLKDNEALYKKYDLLNDKGQIKIVFNNKKTQEWLEKLNQSPYYTFILRKTIGGDRILMFDKNPLQTNLFDKKYLGDVDKDIQSKFFESFNESTALDVLSKISNSKHVLAPLAKRLINHSKGNNVKIILEDVPHFDMSKLEPYEGEGNAYYNPTTNTIHIAKGGSFRGGLSEATIIYEVLHSITYHKLNTSPSNDSTVRDFSKLYNYALTKLNKDDWYGLTDRHEFLVALFTDPKLINELKNIESSKNTKQYTNLFQELFDFLLSLVGIGKTSSLYEQAFAVATHVISESTDSANSMADSIANESIVFSKQDSAKTYGNFDIIENGMPFQHTTILKMKDGDQRVTIRTKDFKSGTYTIGKEQYNIINLGRKNISEFKDKELLKRKFKGDDYTEGNFEHVDNFFKGKENLFIYQITKINNDIKNEAVTIDKSLEANTDKSKINKEPVKPTFEQQYVFFKRKINTLEKQLSRIDENSDEYKIKSTELETFKKRFEAASESNNKAEYIAMAQEYLDWIDEMIKHLPENPDKYTLLDLTTAFDILNTFSDFVGVRDKVGELREQLFPYIVKHNLKTINNFNTSAEEITEEKIDNQSNDERWSTKNFGSLSDIVNYIGRTIGSVIKAAQNKASRNNKMIEHQVQEEVNKLTEYAKENNMSLEDVYDIFLQEDRNTLVLAQKYIKDENGLVVESENYKKIQQNNVLKHFYTFYQKTLKDAESILPYKVGRFYVLNKVKSDIKSDLKRIIPTDDYLFDNFVSNEELIADMVPDMFRTKISADKKSRDLGSGLLQFAAYANNHNELSGALLEARLLQEHLRYKQDKSGNIVERTFINSSDKTRSINAKDSNVYKMVDTVIDMQIKGKMHDNKMTAIKYKEIKDVEGNIIGYKQIHTEDLIDLGLKYNSLLRIGLSPITAIANVIFGDISNFIEAFGGRYFTIKEANQATSIFFKQINYTSEDKSSNLYKWLEKLNPLQELADYEIGENLIANKKKLSKEKLQELMYGMQKKGELYLQSRTMIALLIHDGMMNKDGTNTAKGEAMLNDETSNEPVKLSDKVQRLNQLIHGRYSQREAATLQQSVWFRAAIQFKKWIPAAIEQRMGVNKYDNRLGKQIEGRYRTFAHILLSKDVLSNLNKLAKGELSELETYNMKKNLIEIVLLASTLTMYALVHGGDDDKDRRKKAAAKLVLTLLNRASGDIRMFYSPENILRTATNAIPLSKTVNDVLTAINNIPHAFYDEDSQFKSGSHKGQNKFFTKAANVIIGLKPVMDIQRLINDQQLEELK